MNRESDRWSFALEVEPCWLATTGTKTPKRCGRKFCDRRSESIEVRGERRIEVGGRVIFRRRWFGVVERLVGTDLVGAGE